MPSTEAQIRSSNKYNKEKTKLINIRLNKKTDADIIEWLKGCGNMQGTLKSLIRERIALEKLDPTIAFVRTDT